MKNLYLLLAIAFLPATKIMSQGTGRIISTEYQDYVLTHELTPAGPIPTALDPNGVYPYVSYSETSNRPVLKSYRFIVL